MRLIMCLGACVGLVACATTGTSETASKNSPFMACGGENAVRDGAHERARLNESETGWAYADSMDSVRREYSEAGRFGAVNARSDAQVCGPNGEPIIVSPARQE